MIRPFRNVRRLVRIAYTLASYGALDGLDRLGLPPLLLALARPFQRGDLPPRPGQRLALALTALGPSFVKLGQALSSRSDLLCVVFG
jgi:ubiquinone biosynthesis protein